MATSSSAARAHMAAYFRQEAKEKAEEIEQRTEAEFQAIFAERIKLASRVVHEEAERKKKEKVVLKRIERSRAHTETRVKRMEERNKIMKQVKTECLTELAHVSKNAKYPQLCMYLIVQGLMTITETQVALQCREEDLKIVEAQIEPAMKLYQDFVFAQTGIRPKVQIEVNRSVFFTRCPRQGRDATLLLRRCDIERSGGQDCLPKHSRQSVGFVFRKFGTADSWSAVRDPRAEAVGAVGDRGGAQPHQSQTPKSRGTPQEAAGLHRSGQGIQSLEQGPKVVGPSFVFCFVKGCA